MSTGVQKCDVPLITSSASCGFAPILPVQRCASWALWVIAAAAHSFAAARPFAKAFLAHALPSHWLEPPPDLPGRTAAGFTRICSHCSLVQPSSEGKVRHCVIQANLYVPLQSGSDVLKPLHANTITFLLTVAQFDQVSDTRYDAFPQVCVRVVALSGGLSVCVLKPRCANGTFTPAALPINRPS